MAVAEGRQRIHWKSLPTVGRTSFFGSGGKSGSVEVTELYRQLYEAAGDIEPVSGNTSKGSSLTTVSNPPP
jgi:hypothetical protein